ncbi:P-loop containing nucleoside triphosphate hydrolase protein [Mycena metata]|uniref:P-loop containing nucleoside triphosphate hydrolase protein n=1 Tax=Mycena metata TaxID=1033252 RepID=A0AAD7MMR3_9AGAR|nr:P-loop containing nucleoside triphosphate hydrolase protein [Mycena metata]
MLPSEPKIFHGRESEVMDILRLFQRATPRIVILGAGGMGKTCLARSVLQHAEVCGRYTQHRYFVACDSATTSLEFVALIASHLGLKPGKDGTRPLISYFSDSVPSFLILDNLESAWEPPESRRQVEELLSLLTDINHLALIVTMRGEERPEKVMWTRPFLPPLQPLAQSAAREMFFDITDEIYDLEDVDSVLSLTDNMPLAINLLAHLADSEGCSHCGDRSVFHAG